MTKQTQETEVIEVAINREQYIAVLAMLAASQQNANDPVGWIVGKAAQAAAAGGFDFVGPEEKLATVKVTHVAGKQDVEAVITGAKYQPKED